MEEVSDVEINENEVVVYLQPSNELHFAASHYGYYDLIRKMPKGFKSFDYEFVERVFERLEGCETCGLLAVKDVKCLACGSAKWDISMLSKFDSKEAYLIQEQIDLFEPLDDEDEINLNNTPEDGFQSDLNWKPVITEQELIERFRRIK